jgi:hypothetical protein
MEDELYTLEDLTLREIRALRTGLNFIQISGADAFFMGTLQIKINDQIKQIEDHLNQPTPTTDPPIEND